MTNHRFSCPVCYNFSMAFSICYLVFVNVHLCGLNFPWHQPCRSRDSPLLSCQPITAVLGTHCTWHTLTLTQGQILADMSNSFKLCGFCHKLALANYSVATTVFQIHCNSMTKTTLIRKLTNFLKVFTFLATWNHMGF